VIFVHYFLNLKTVVVSLTSQMSAKQILLSDSSSVSATHGPNEFQYECSVLFGELVNALGIPRSVGEIYGVLFASPMPMSFSDVVECLGISKGSASQGLQLLRSLGAINLSSERQATVNSHPTYRATTYEAELSLRQLMTGVLRERIAPLAALGAERQTRLCKLAAGSDFHLNRVRQLETWRLRLKAMLPMLSALLGPKKSRR
jgi:hypothetical protein